MKGFLKFVGTVAVSVCLTLVIVTKMLHGGQFELQAKSLTVVSPKSSVHIDECGVSVHCEDGGLMQLRPGKVVGDREIELGWASDTPSGTFTLQDKNCRHGVEIGIRDTLPFVYLKHDGRVQAKHSLQGDGF